MHELPGAIPDPQVLLSLQAEELGGKMIFLMRKRCENRTHDGFIFSNLIDESGPRITCRTIVLPILSN